MNNIDEKIKSILSEEQIPPLSCDFAIKRTINNLKSKKRFSFKNIKTCIATVCCSILLVTGIVFAKDIENYIKTKFELGKGIQTAVENGYIEEIDMDYMLYNTDIIDSTGEFLDEANIGIKVNDFMIDDYHLSLEFGFKFDDNVSKNVRLDKIYNIKLNDLIIVDEEDRILYSVTNEEFFNKFCEEKSLDYIYSEFNENYFNCGLNAFTRDYDSSKNTVNLTYNMYLEGEEYPKSKELNLYFSKIEIESKDFDLFYEKVESGEIKGGEILDDIIYEEEITLSGEELSIHLDVPAKMYLREVQEFEVVSCDNENFDVYATKVTDTGFEIGIIVSNLENPDYPKELAEQEHEIFKQYGKSSNPNANDSEDSNVIQIPTTSITFEDITKYYENSPYKTMYEEYYTKHYPLGNVRENFIHWYPKTEGDYVLNSNGEKFFLTKNVGGKGSYKFIDENTFNYYGTFDMTKYDTTDKISVVIYLYGEPYHIELEKI